MSDGTEALGEPEHILGGPTVQLVSAEHRSRGSPAVAFLTFPHLPAVFLTGAVPLG